MRDVSNFVPFVLIPFIGWGVRRSLIKRSDYSYLKKRTLAIGLLAFFATEMARSFYRPFVYANDINDYFIADTVGNSLGTVTAIFMVLTLSGSGTSRDWYIVALLIVGLVGYEVLSFGSYHALDVRDVEATILFGGLSALLYWRLLIAYDKRRQSPPTHAR
jgi:hypothetical protein